MDVSINHPRQHKEPARIHNLVGVMVTVLRLESNDPPLADVDINRRSPFVYDG